MSLPDPSDRRPVGYVQELEAELARERTAREQAERERDLLREAVPDADAAYWQDRTLDHATAYDKMRVRAVLAEKRAEAAESRLREAGIE